MYSKSSGIYWLSIDYKHRFVKYGHGEIRDRCTVLRADIAEDEIEYFKHIRYTHISFNNSRDLNEYKWYEFRVLMKIGSDPVIRDPPLIIVEREHITTEQLANRIAMLPERLEGNSKELYADVSAYKLITDDFPDFYQAIEHSIRSPTGWCHSKLANKSSIFGKSDKRSTYLRITIGSDDSKSPGIPFVFEIWPPGHRSPIHAHAKSYGIIRVLHGEIKLKLYRTIQVKKPAPFYETNLRENQYTWLAPGLNQIHRLENFSTNKSVFTLQAYEYMSSETLFYEYFDYINNDHSAAVSHYFPDSDMDFFKFKEKMMEEWTSAHK